MIDLTDTIIANEQLPNSKQTLYTVPASTIALVTSITLVNTGASLTCNLYYKRSGGTSRRIIPKDMTLTDKHACDEILTLRAGDVVEGDATTAAQVDYKINGAEFSVS